MSSFRAIIPPDVCPCKVSGERDNSSPMKHPIARGSLIILLWQPSFLIGQFKPHFPAKLHSHSSRALKCSQERGSAESNGHFAPITSWPRQAFWIPNAEGKLSVYTEGTIYVKGAKQKASGPHTAHRSSLLGNLIS